MAEHAGVEMTDDGFRVVAADGRVIYEGENRTLAEFFCRAYNLGLDDARSGSILAEQNAVEVAERSAYGRAREGAALEGGRPPAIQRAIDEARGATPPSRETDYMADGPGNRQA